MLTPLVAAISLAATQKVLAVTLERKFSKGSTYSYTVKSHMLTETSQTGGVSGIPQEVDYVYKFAAKIVDVQKSGFASIDYTRPNITEIQGETFERGPVTRVIPLDMHLTMQLSPINEVTDVKELSKKADSKPKGKLKKAGQLMAITRLGAGVARQNLPFLTDLQRTALFIGSPVDGLDFSPKLPIEPVKIGGTWKRTVSYQPQDLAGNKHGKQAVQRVDMVYTYLGPKFVGDREIQSVHAEINLDTDATQFVADSLEMTKAESPVKSMLVKLKSDFDFQLDAVDFHTLGITGRTTGAYTVQFITGNQLIDFTQKLTGKTSVTQN